MSILTWRPQCEYRCVCILRALSLVSTGLAEVLSDTLGPFDPDLPRPYALSRLNSTHWNLFTVLIIVILVSYCAHICYCIMQIYVANC
jgi:hypothetical protein